MICAWNEFLSILPLAIRDRVDKQGKTGLQELRLRVGKPVQLVTGQGILVLSHTASESDLNFVVNTASRYSPWAASSVAKGFLTAPGGHRIGLCGEVIIRESQMTGLRNLSSVCIRVARDFPGIAEKLGDLQGSILILGPPGCGKTTLLRDLIRQLSARGECVSVVDERYELFPQSQQSMCFETGMNTDILAGCSKELGLSIALRTMGPSCIAVDEISSVDDCEALTQAGWCGVRLLATVHGKNALDLKTRPIYRYMVEKGLFDWLVVMGKDKSCYPERMVR